MVRIENIDLDERADQQQGRDTQKDVGFIVSDVAQKAADMADESRQQDRGEQEDADESGFDRSFDIGIMEMEASAGGDKELIPQSLGLGETFGPNKLDSRRRRKDSAVRPRCPAAKDRYAR